MTTTLPKKERRRASLSSWIRVTELGLSSGMLLSGGVGKIASRGKRKRPRTVIASGQFIVSGSGVGSNVAPAEEMIETDLKNLGGGGVAGDPKGRAGALRTYLICYNITTNIVVK
jgi:hypothetical protein